MSDLKLRFSIPDGTKHLFVTLKAERVSDGEWHVSPEASAGTLRTLSLVAKGLVKTVEIDAAGGFAAYCEGRWPSHE